MIDLNVYFSMFDIIINKLDPNKQFELNLLFINSGVFILFCILFILYLFVDSRQQKNQKG